MGQIVQDLRYAWRTMRRSWGFTIVAVSTLALGIGANAAVFTVLNSVILRPLPYPDSDQLVRMYPSAPARGMSHGAFSLPDFQDWRARSQLTEAMGLYTSLPSGPVLTGGLVPEQVATAYVSGDFFSALGVEAQLGRTLSGSEEYVDNRVVVIGHDYWMRRFGGDPSLVGSTITLDDMDFVVVGVMPAGFGFPSTGVEMWAFLTIIPPESTPVHLRVVRFMNVVARLKPGVSHAQARDELSAIASGLAEQYGDTNSGLTAATILSLHESVVGNVRTALLVLLGAVGFVLLIACANVANLLLARGMTRRREVAIRAAIGARRGRLVGQLLVESTSLGLAGGAAGFMLAMWGVDLVMRRSAGTLPRAAEVAPDFSVFAFAIGLSLVTGLVFGLLPAVQGSRLDVTRELKDAGRQSGGGSGRTGLRRSLVAAEVAIALVLLIGAGLLVRSLVALQRVDPGFRAENVLAVTFTVNDARYPERAQYMAFYRAALARMDALPGVMAAGSIRHLPLRGAGEQVDVVVPGAGDATANAAASANRIQVSPGFFRTMGVELRAGRDFSDDDRADGPLVAVVNQRLVDEYFGSMDPVGRTAEIGGASVQVVGVVGNVRHHALNEAPRSTIYVPQEQNPRRGMTIVARTDSQPLAQAGAVRDLFRSLDPDQPIAEIVALEHVVSESVARPRFLTLLLGTFAALAMVLSAMGIYGVLSYSVRERLHEIGVRIALGAHGPDVRAMVIRQGMTPALVGLLVGLVGAVALTRLMGSLLFGVTPLDPAAYAAAALGLAGVSLVACYVPARGATRADPLAALREQ